MGNIGSSPMRSLSSLWEHREFVESLVAPGEIKRVIHVCLMCQRDGGSEGYGKPITRVKQAYRELLKSLYNTNPSTIFTWTTLDTADADIVKGDGVMDGAAPVFDVAISVWCQPQTPDFIRLEDYRTMCRLLKPKGFLLFHGGQRRLESIRNNRDIETVRSQFTDENQTRGWIQSMRRMGREDPEGFVRDEHKKWEERTAASNIYQQLTCGQGVDMKPLFSVKNEVIDEVGIFQKV